MNAREIVHDPNNCWYVLRNEHGAATCHIRDGRARDMSSHRAAGEGDRGAKPCEFVPTGFCVCDGTSLPPVRSNDPEDIYSTLRGYLPQADWPQAWPEEDDDDE